MIPQLALHIIAGLTPEKHEVRIVEEEREAVEMMLALEMRRLGLTPDISSKQRSKNAFRSRKRGFNL